MLEACTSVRQPPFFLVYHNALIKGLATGMTTRRPYLTPSTERLTIPFCPWRCGVLAHFCRQDSFAGLTGETEVLEKTSLYTFVPIHERHTLHTDFGARQQVALHSAQQIKCDNNLQFMQGTIYDLEGCHSPPAPARRAKQRFESCSFLSLT